MTTVTLCLCIMTIMPMHHAHISCFNIEFINRYILLKPFSLSIFSSLSFCSNSYDRDENFSRFSFNSSFRSAICLFMTLIARSFSASMIFSFSSNFFLSSSAFKTASCSATKYTCMHGNVQFHVISNCYNQTH